MWRGAEGCDQTASVQGLRYCLYAGIAARLVDGVERGCLCRVLQLWTYRYLTARAQGRGTWRGRARKRGGARNHGTRWPLMNERATNAIDATAPASAPAASADGAVST